MTAAKYLYFFSFLFLFGCTVPVEFYGIHAKDKKIVLTDFFQNGFEKDSFGDQNSGCNLFSKPDNKQFIILFCENKNGFLLALKRLKTNMRSLEDQKNTEIFLEILKSENLSNYELKTMDYTYIKQFLE